MSKKNTPLSDEARLVEAILFVENEPVSLEKLALMTKLTTDVVKKSCEEIKDFFFETFQGLDLIYHNGRYSFVPTGDLHNKIKKAYGKKVDSRLQKTALETLAVVAYQQPITRKEIDNFRGVSSEAMVKLLKDREYIKVLGRRSAIGAPCEYGTTRKFLEEFNLTSISELPRLSEVDQQRFAKELEEDEEQQSLFEDIDDEE